MIPLHRVSRGFATLTVNLTSTPPLGSWGGPQRRSLRMLPLELGELMLAAFQPGHGLDPMDGL